MRRFIAVVLVALLMAHFVGLGGSPVEGATPGLQTNPAVRPEVVKKLGRIPLKSVVKIQRLDGKKLTAYLEEVTADAITVTVIEKDTLTKATIPLAEIRSIELAGGRTTRKVLITTGIVFGVLVGACAAAAASATTSATSGASGDAAH